MRRSIPCICMCICICLLAFCSGRAQQLASAFPVIDGICKAYAERNHIPGLVYGIVADGKLVHTGAFGFEDLDKKTAATARSVFRIASMTKSFTAMAILSLRDAG